MRDHMTWSEAHDDEVEGCLMLLFYAWTAGAIAFALTHHSWPMAGKAAVGVLILILWTRRHNRILAARGKRRREELERYAAEKAVREATRLERAARRRGGR